MQAGEQGFRHLYIDGGEWVQAFLAEGLIDQLILTQVPVLLGAGRRLFGDLAADQAFELVASQSFPFGFVQSTYRLRRP